MCKHCCRVATIRATVCTCLVAYAASKTRVTTLIVISYALVTRSSSVAAAQACAVRCTAAIGYSGCSSTITRYTISALAIGVKSAGVTRASSMCCNYHMWCLSIGQRRRKHNHHRHRYRRLWCRSFRRNMFHVRGEHA